MADTHYKCLSSYKLIQNLKSFNLFFHLWLIFSKSLQNVLKRLHRSNKGYQLLGSQFFESTRFYVIGFSRPFISHVFFKFKKSLLLSKFT